MKPGNRHLCTVLILADLRQLFRVWEMREFMDINKPLSFLTSGFFTL
ncbi:hypothetical protein DFQ01_12012 [Paenibacillus cellulosilyticus]|uniref:Uncharacterized protein n=1 Tax=Paenibacillus cellulosilyticus TaxID=375489 RepID=A0A2V2YRG9_9BACL|nr:hypothetical protein DFQ01_12012 [Paenibacillus cellulosilyticus]